jgi:hypothetical protein
MKTRFGMIAVLLSASVLVSGQTTPARDLVAHEWGTFTSIAGADGEAVEWLPQAGPTDLPDFVGRITCNLKTSLTGKVRMETPVIYFYAPREISVNVRVRFPQGVITEWFPEPAAAGDTVVNNAFRGQVAWTNVKVKPGTPAVFPVDRTANHYYVARNTDAAPLDVLGQSERFLFYRGVGRTPPSINARVTADGQIVVSHADRGSLGDIILFENRNGLTAYAAQHTSGAHAAFNALELAGEGLSPELQLEKTLVAHGLYPKEAKAMIESWRGSWFEHGTRLFYIVSGYAVDAILPLQIDPQPVDVKRVFVGRLEIATPTTLREVKNAIQQKDRATLDRYGRFLQPIGKQLLAAAPPAERWELHQGLQSAYTESVPTTCRGASLLR